MFEMNAALAVTDTNQSTASSDESGRTKPAVISDMTGQELKDFIELSINEWRSSEMYKLMVQGQKYFENDNDIINNKRQIIGVSGEMVDAKHLSNNKLAHSFMRKLTKQKIGYLLSKPFTLSSDNEDFKNNIKNYFDKNFYRLFKNSSQDAVICGRGWIQIYYNDNGALSFKRIPSIEIMPFWRDIDHTELEAAIRTYNVEVFDGKEKKTVEHVQLFRTDIIYNFIREKDGLTEDADNPSEPNFTLYESEEDAEGKKIMWGKIPLIPLKYNAEENSLLKYIKSLVDDYDKRTSDLSNVLQDEPDRIKVVKNYDGTNKEEFVYNLAKLRTVFLRENGGVETLDTSISSDALENHLKRLREDIYEFGGGVDTQNKSLGTGTSGIALKFIYSDLDMDCTDFGAELAWSLEQISWFIKQDLLLKVKKDYTDASFDAIFNTDIVINEAETVTNIKNSVGILSDKTLREQHPYVTDAALEEERIAEQEEAIYNEFKSEYRNLNPDLNVNQSTTLPEE